MRLGFNHNVQYKDQVYHVQTEDSGVKNPHVITLLYRGGTILASKKTSYADIVSFENLDLMVDDLMKEQHKGMLRALKTGAYDEKIAAIDRPAPRPPSPPSETRPPIVPVPEDTASAVLEAAEGEALRSLDEGVVSNIFEIPVDSGEVSDVDDLLSLLEVQVQKKEEKSLDDAVFDFFSLK